MVCVVLPEELAQGIPHRRHPSGGVVADLSLAAVTRCARLLSEPLCIVRCGRMVASPVPPAPDSPSAVQLRAAKNECGELRLWVRPGDVYELLHSRRAGPARLEVSERILRWSAGSACSASVALLDGDSSRRAFRIADSGGKARFFWISSRDGDTARKRLGELSELLSASSTLSELSGVDDGTLRLMAIAAVALLAQAGLQPDAASPAPAATPLERNSPTEEAPLPQPQSPPPPPTMQPQTPPPLPRPETQGAGTTLSLRDLQFLLQKPRVNQSSLEARPK
jgi:hypothetical protein